MAIAVIQTAYLAEQRSPRKSNRNVRVCLVGCPDKVNYNEEVIVKYRDCVRGTEREISGCDIEQT